ncbi:pyridoxal phosphate-dependent transferase [Aspergillus spinulosporus]
MTDYHLSQRAAYNSVHGDVWGPREQSMGNPWSPSNPTGTVNLRLAENSLMHEDIAEYIKSQINVLAVQHLTYSTGPRGSRRLRGAAAQFLNEAFHACQPITANNIFVTPGLASAIDALAWCICNDGDGILIPQPLYNGFQVDILNRSNAQVVPVSYTGVDGYSTLDDLFRPNVNRKALEAAYNRAKDSGITVRALLISNPHNPLGRCYPPETIEEFVLFCAAHRLHFISDEIYAHSVFENPALPNATPFVSVLSFDILNFHTIDPTMVHVLYGASKDFCANGLRLGIVCTRNQGIIRAMSSISMFSWSPHLLQDVWAGMLEDEQWMTSFMARKRELMADHYAIAARFFRECGIPFYEMNAGLFFWINLRHPLFPSSRSNSESAPTSADEKPSSLSVTSSESDELQRREQRICNICMEHGVLIAPGHVYMAEEPGWFRITFTVGREALEEGLRRLKESLLSVRAEAEAGLKP